MWIHVRMYDTSRKTLLKGLKDNVTIDELRKIIIKEFQLPMETVPLSHNEIMLEDGKSCTYYEIKRGTRIVIEIGRPIKAISKEPTWIEGFVSPEDSVPRSSTLAVTYLTGEPAACTSSDPEQLDGCARSSISYSRIIDANHSKNMPYRKRAWKEESWYCGIGDGMDVIKDPGEWFDGRMCYLNPLPGIDGDEDRLTRSQYKGKDLWVNISLFMLDQENGILPDTDIGPRSWRAFAFANIRQGSRLVVNYSTTSPRECDPWYDFTVTDTTADSEIRTMNGDLLLSDRLSRKCIIVFQNDETCEIGENIHLGQKRAMETISDEDVNLFQDCIDNFRVIEASQIGEYIPLVQKRTIETIPDVDDNIILNWLYNCIATRAAQMAENVPLVQKKAMETFPEMDVNLFENWQDPFLDIHFQREENIPVVKRDPMEIFPDGDVKQRHEEHVCSACQNVEDICTTCGCRGCGLKDFNMIIFCMQCVRRYHVSCVPGLTGYPTAEIWLCPDCE